MHGGPAFLPVHAWRGAHAGAHLRRHAAHVGGHARTVWPCTHLSGSYPAGRHGPIRGRARLTGYGVHGAAHAGDAGVVGVGHPRIAGLPGITWKCPRSISETVWGFVRMAPLLLFHMLLHSVLKHGHLSRRFCVFHQPGSNFTSALPVLTSSLTKQALSGPRCSLL